MFENLTDPILSGREELGFPKVYPDIQVTDNSSDSCHVVMSWRGYIVLTWFVRLRIILPPFLAQADQWRKSDSGEEQSPGGTFEHTCVSSTGTSRNGARMDIDYDVLIPDSPNDGIRSIITKRVPKSESAEVKTNNSGVGKLLTLHRIVSHLTEIPVYGVVNVEINEENDVTDMIDAYRIE